MASSSLFVPFKSQPNKRRPLNKTRGAPDAILGEVWWASPARRSTEGVYTNRFVYQYWAGVLLLFGL
eukprot:scaffold222_cov175-Amphora_coffeaeformis.AAC.4